MNAEPSEPAVVKPQNGRMGKPKTRTGCVTCKTRRIKCDEQKPSCKRCTLTGRICDGYRQQQPLPRKRAPVAIRPRTSTPADMQLDLVINFRHQISAQSSDNTDTSLNEERSLEYFRCCTATIMSHWLVETFWKYQLPQTAQSKPATRHAMIAVAEVHENLQIQWEGRPNDPRLSEEAIARRLQSAHHHYDIAVSELARALHRRTDTEEITLMVCVLFVLYNFVIGHFTAAVFHLHNGIEILSRWMTTKTCDQNFNEGSLEKNLITLFGRLSYGSKSLDDPLSTSESQVSTTASTFTSLEEAEMSMHLLSREGMRLLRVGALIKHSSQTTEILRDLDTSISTYRVALDNWQTQLEDLLPRIPLPHSDSDVRIITLLRINHLVSQIWIWTIFHFPETPEPIVILERFLNLVDHLHAKWLDGKIHCPSGTHIFDLGIIPPLNFIAKRSVCPILSDRAQKLLIKAAPLILNLNYPILFPVRLNLGLGGGNLEEW